MISKERYEELKSQHEEASRTNDYSKMIMVSDANSIAMREYYRENICSHPAEYIEERQGGQIEHCRLCDKKWG